MASIQLPGLSTGLDTTTIVAQLMQVERRRLTMFESSIAKRKETRTAVNELQSKLNAFKSALSALSNASQLRAYNATSSNSDKLSIAAAAGANEGSHSVKVKQLATANRWVHDGFKYATSYVGAGTFIFSYNNQEVIIQTNDTTTLQDMVNMINSDPKNPGVTAGILKYDDGSGNPFHLVLNGRESGTDFQIAIHTSNAEVHRRLPADDARQRDADRQTVGADGFFGAGHQFPKCQRGRHRRRSTTARPSTQPSQSTLTQPWKT